NRMAIMSKVLGQCRKPAGWLGRMVARGMNISHAQMTDWGIGHISIGKSDTILDVGCGGGGTIRKLAIIASEGKVYGIDYSAESVRISTRTNRELIDAGRVEVGQGTVSSLPYPDALFDLVTAIESHYFWPDLVNDMNEVLRVLKPGGTLVLMGGEYRGGKYDQRNGRWVELGDMAYHSIDEFERLFRRVGYTEVRVLEEAGKGWMCGIGRKP
ncbi:MAG: class I SAM-dependent methyltransferase, partial [Anaerolineae bacterium]